MKKATNKMKDRDFEKLKEICEANGFELVTESPDENDKFYVMKKNAWHGVEFAECESKIYKADKITDFQIITSIILEDGTNLCLRKKLCKPSTESEYLEQLIKETKERFENIKETDIIDRSHLNSIWGKITAKEFKNSIYNYDKENDILYFGGAGIYKNGKWAKVIPGSVEVKYIDWIYYNPLENNVSLIFNFSEWERVKDRDDLGDYIAQQIENWVNRIN